MNRTLAIILVALMAMPVVFAADAVPSAQVLRLTMLILRILYGFVDSET